MGRDKGKKRAQGVAGRRPPQTGRTSSRVSRILLGLAAAVALAGLYWAISLKDPNPDDTERIVGAGSTRRAERAAVGSTDFQALVGTWVRPDGGYTLAVRRVEPDGSVEAGYFNPRPIHVSRARASLENEKIRLFLELQGEGYPGSTYELIHDPGRDILAGVYFQAAMQQRFDVVFVRGR
jgi:hypothetical protein